MFQGTVVRFAVLVATGLVIAGAVICARAAHGRPAHAGEGTDERPDLGTFNTAVEPIFKARCLTCHGPERQKGQLRLDTIDGDLVHGKDGAVWKEIYDRLNRGEMPPDTEPRPPSQEVEKVVLWILSEMRKGERAASSSGGRVVVRRMNRAEYANTLSDLLHLQFPFGDGPLDLLPPDGTAGGFDKMGSALMVDPSLLSQYLAVARRVADAAVVTGPRPYESQRRRWAFADTARSLAIGYECGLPQFQCRKNDLVIMENPARTWDHLRFDQLHETTVPIDGVYTIRVRMSADLGARGEPLKVRLVWPDDTTIAAWTLTGSEAKPRVFEATLPIKVAGKNQEGPQVHLVNGTQFFLPDDVASRIRREAERAAAAGDAAKAQKLRELAEIKAATVSVLPNPAARDTARLPKLILDWIEIEGPILPEWPPKSHREIFFEGPGAKKDLGYARRIFARLMARAYRRPVSAHEIDPVISGVERELKAGETFEEAIKMGLEYVLCSPSFLFLLEPNVGPPRPLNDFELAARLSYFLWSSMPDDELTRRAAEGQLRSPDILASQVSRMLRDPKSRALVDGFGAEWLQASRFAGIPPNRHIYKDWDDELESAVKREPIAFFEEILRNDLSALNFLDSDFAMLNGRLARHYGIAGVEGETFRRVALPAGSHRGGLVTQAGILTIGSDGTRTLPVRRASWILQTLFNSPPPPPPPNVREIEANIAGARLTVRERLLRHQQLPACAACHAKIDPYGLALENFDAVGAWRSRQNGEDFGAGDKNAPPINVSGKLPDGRSFGTAAQFRALLSADAPRFARALAEKMFGYALGRSVEAVDGDVVESLAASFRGHGYRMTTLIEAIASSQIFQTK